MGGSGRAVYSGPSPRLTLVRLLSTHACSLPVLQDLLEANLEAAASKGRRAKKLSFRAIQEGDFDNLEEALAPGKCA